MPYKNLEKRKEQRKKYYQENREAILLQQKNADKLKFDNLSEEDRQAFIIKRREIANKSYHKNKHLNKDKRREQGLKARLKYAYGLTFEDYNILLEKQDYKCGVCKCLEFEKNWTLSKTLPFVVDHCHKTGKIRGLLCCSCNLLLGHAYNNIEILKNSIKYLEEWR